MQVITKKALMDRAKISKNVLTNYCEELEEQGYYFDLNANGHRIYNEDDLEKIIRIKEVMKRFEAIDLKLHEAVNLVLTDHDQEFTENDYYQNLIKESEVSIASTVEEAYDVKNLSEPPMNAIELVERISTEFNEMKFSQYQILDRINTVEDVQLKMMEAFDKIEKDRDQVLMMSLRLLLDNKATLDRIENNKNKKGSWKFWKKDEKKQP